jgi:hypothetical protein
MAVGHLKSLPLNRVNLVAVADADTRCLARGTLAEADRRIYFEYDSAFLRNPLYLSPFKLPPEPGVHEHRDLGFGPLFGLFDDSLPDGCGLLLMDRHFRNRGVAFETLSPLSTACRRKPRRCPPEGAVRRRWGFDDFR